MTNLLRIGVINHSLFLLVFVIYLPLGNVESDRSLMNRAFLVDTLYVTLIHPPNKLVSHESHYR